MKALVLVLRTLFGLGFVMFGANILFPFLPQPPVPPGSPVAQFMDLFVGTHWMWLVGATQLVGGLLVLRGGTAPAGLALLAPVLVNILAFHVCVTNGEGLAPGLVFSALELFLIYVYRDHFRGLLATRARPRVPGV